MQRLHKEAARLMLETRGKPNDGLVAGCSLGLAEVLKEEKQWRRAEQQYKLALSSLREAQGLNHPDTLMAARHFAVVLKRLGKFNEAEILYREV